MIKITLVSMWMVTCLMFTAHVCFHLQQRIARYINKTDLFVKSKLYNSLVVAVAMSWIGVLFWSCWMLYTAYQISLEQPTFIKEPIFFATWAGFHFYYLSDFVMGISEQVKIDDHVWAIPTKLMLLMGIINAVLLFLV